MAIPAVRAVGTVAESVIDHGTGLAITPGMPAGTLTDDILLLFVETQAEAITFSGGTETWTEVADSPQNLDLAGAGNDVRLTVFWARASQDTPTSPTSSTTSDHSMGRIIAFSGCITTGDPWNVTAPGTTDSTLDATVSVAGDTTTVDDCLIVAAVAQSLPDAAGTAEFSSWTNASLSSVTEQIDNTTAAAGGGALGVATGGKASAGAYSATTATAATSSTRVCMSIALKPPATGAASQAIVMIVGL